MTTCQAVPFIMTHETNTIGYYALVQGQFVGVLINQRHLYDAELRRVLADNQSLRDKADYRAELVTATQASRALRRSRLFVAAVRQRGGVVQ